MAFPHQSAISFGSYGVSILNAKNLKPLHQGLITVTSNVEISRTTELITATGGAWKAPVATEYGATETSISFTCLEVPYSVFQAVGASSTITAASDNGTVSALSNVEGTSVFDATTGIASITVDTPANLRGNLYVIEAVSATTVNLYSSATQGFSLSPIVTPNSNTLQLFTTATVTSGGTIAFADLGITLNAGSGTIGMTVGDTAVFSVVEPHNGFHRHILGTDGAAPIAVALEFLSQKRVNGEYTKIFIPNATIGSLPFSMSSFEFSEVTIEGTTNIGTDPISGLTADMIFTQVDGL